MPDKGKMAVSEAKRRNLALRWLEGIAPAGNCVKSALLLQRNRPEGPRPQAKKCQALQTKPPHIPGLPESGGAFREARKAPGGPENPERARKGPERARIALHPERPGKGPERPGKARKGPERPGKARIGPERPGRC